MFCQKAGQFQVLEQVDHPQSPIYQVPSQLGGLLTSFDLSPSKQVLAFGDNCGKNDDTITAFLVK